jgi:hypothetical protein
MIGILVFCAMCRMIALIFSATARRSARLLHRERCGMIERGVGRDNSRDVIGFADADRFIASAARDRARFLLAAAVSPRSALIARNNSSRR